MRRYLLSSLFLTILPLSAQAQNYIQSNNYSGAGVVVNMDVLNAPAPSAVTPVMSDNLPPVMPAPAPIRMRPPQPRVITPSSLVPTPAATAVTPMSAPMAPLTAPPMMDSGPSTNEVSDLPAPKYIAPSLPSGIAASPEKPTSFTSQKRQALGSMHDAPDEDIDNGSTATAMPMPAPPMVDEMAPNAPIPAAAPVANAPAVSPVTSSTNSEGASNTSNFEAYRLFFDPTSDVLKPSEAAVLDKMAAKLSSDASLRLQVRAYADGTADNAGAARRLSLSRSLKVRDYLMQKNIAATRLDIRALGTGSMEMGDQVGSGKAPPDRVDLIFSK